MNFKNIVLIIFGSLIFLSCANAPNDLGTENVLKIATSYKIQTLAPQESASYFLIEYGIAETPLFLDDEANLKPHLLESYEQIDEKNWKLVVRDKVFFHNGKSLTAEKFAAAMDFQLKNSPATQSLLQNASVKANGEREIILTTETPNPNIPNILADESGFPIFDVECVETANGNSSEIIKNGCYTGAYKLKSLDDREMILERFEKYWQGMPPLEKAIVKFVPDAQVRILTVQSGEADIALYPPSEAKRILENQPNAIFKTSENASGGARIFLNIRRPPFDDVNVRRAASLGINYESLANEVFDGVYQTANGFYPPIYKFAVQNQRTDLETAKKLLDEADWTLNANNLRTKNGKVLTVILLTYPQQPDWVTLATAIQANLLEIGFDVKIRQVEDIQTALKANDWDFGIISPGITTNGGTPEPLLREFLTTNGEKNYGGISDTELDNLVETLSKTFDQTKRNEILRRIQEIIIVEKTYEIRPVFSRSKVVVGQKFKNYKPSPHLHHITFETKPN